MITAIRNIISGLILTVAALLPQSVYGFAIDVEAGEPTTICYGSFLDLSALGASITGDVTDGTWFSTGDGLFLPGNTAFVAFSEGTFYQPGPQDLSSGSFQLILASDDPDGIGPEVQVNDQVTITIMTAPPLSCSGEINVSLDETCTQMVDVQLLVPNPVQPVGLYVVVLFDEQGDIIQDNILTNEHIGQLISYTVGHSCTANTCSGSITVSDNIAPFLNCIDAVIDCSQASDPDAIGLPIPFFATATPLGSTSYTVEGLDGCGTVILTYQDDVTAMECSQGLSSRIVRQWTATDVNNNGSSCSQNIDVQVLGLSSVTIPQDFDNVEQPALECNGPWTALPNGHPSPQSTGMPTFSGCTNMEATYTDILFDHCGAGFKVLRKWLVIDWCTTEHMDINQIIEVADSQAPMFECAEDLVIGTEAYLCASLPFEALFEEPVVDCSQWTYSIEIFDVNNVDQSEAYVDGYTVAGMPVGVYTLVYEIVDECGNKNTCQRQLTVIDDKAPFAICDQYTQIAIQSTGSARLFATSVNDTSYDNCGVASMSVQRMNDNCGTGTDWSPFVDFCCDDIGASVMVQFRVTDFAGLSNTCMVEVLVEDKLPPVLFCPTDLTISCDYVFDTDDLSEFGVIRTDLNSVQQIIINDNHNGGVAGSDGYFSDNCSAVLTETSSVSVDCGQGLITRNFTVTDADGNTDQCSQLITIINDNPFTNADISWPSNYSDIGCDSLQATVDVTGAPLLATDRCADVASTYEDLVFNLGGSACVKILRYWTVIDWCQYNGDTGAGTWDYIQEIKLLNDIAPLFTTCSDTSFCEYESCDVHLLNLSIAAEDDCTEASALTYTWDLDLSGDGTVDANGIGANIDRVVALGMHTVVWTVADGCGNTTTCTQEISISECKLPTPYCHAGIATTLMPSSGSLQIWARDFDLGSTDNCTSASELAISFSTDILDTSLVLTCADIPNGVATVVPLQIWVTDAQGNQDYCSVELLLQDNQDSCLDGDLNGRLAGVVKTRTNLRLPDVEVAYSTYVEGYSGSVTTNSTGTYAATELPLYLGYGVKPMYDGGPQTDVNTIDLIAIQRHILGIAPLDNPYDLIAADVTNNGKVQSSDLLILRKHILGILPIFPNVAKWKFVPEAFEFADVEDPFDFTDSLEIEHLTEPLDTLDWIAVRMGNVNGVFNLANKKPASESRNDRRVELSIQTALQRDGTYLTKVIATEDMLVDGLQFSLANIGGHILSATSDIFSNEEYAIVDGRLHIANTQLDQEITEESLLITLVSETNEVSLSKHLEPLAIGEEVRELYLSETKVATGEQLEESSIVILTNPVLDEIRFNLSGTFNQDMANVVIYSNSGAVVHSARYGIEGTVRVPAEVLGGPGVYILQVSIGDRRFTRQLVKI